jgi:hypothetical protein
MKEAAARINGIAMVHSTNSGMEQRKFPGRLLQEAPQCSKTLLVVEASPPLHVPLIRMLPLAQQNRIRPLGAHRGAEGLGQSMPRTKLSRNLGVVTMPRARGSE